MNKKILKTIILLTILLIGVLMNNTVFAAGSFSVNKTTATITEGKTTTFKINGSSATGKVNITSSNTDVATVSSASVWLENNSSTITITAKKAGTATITVSGKVSDSKGVEDTITRTIAVTVNAKATNNVSNTNTATNNNTGTTTEKTKAKSTNAYLSTLGVRLSESDAKALGVNVNAYDFSGFKKATLTYNVTVPYDVNSLKVSCKAADSGASIKISGNSDFEVGSNNKITIKVTAEDGKTTKTYTIKVTKLAEEEEKPGNIIENEIYLTSLGIKGISISPEFSKDIYAYTATLEKPNVTEVEVTAKANKENVNIEISGNTNLVVGENVINIVLKENGTSSQVVYQVTLKKAEVIVTNSGEETNFMSNLIGNIKNYILIAVTVVVAIIIAIIILIILLVKENKKIKNEESNIYNNKTQLEETNQELTNETETKNKRKITQNKEKGRHSN